MEKNNYLKKLHTTHIKILDEVVRICNKYNLTYFLTGGTLLGAARHHGFIPWDDDLDISMPREDFDKFINIFSKELGEEYYLDFYTTNKKYFREFAKVRLKNTIFIENTISNFKTNNEIWIDIFPLDYVSEQNNLKKQKFFIDKIYVVNMAKSGVKVQFGKIKKFLILMFSCFFSRNRLCKIQQSIMKKQNKSRHIDSYINFGSQYGIVKQNHLIERYYPISKLPFEGKEYNVPNDYDYVLKKIYGGNYMEIPPKEKQKTHKPLKVVFENGEEVRFDEKI